MATESICRLYAGNLVAPAYRTENESAAGNTAILPSQTERTALTTASFSNVGATNAADAVNTLANRLLSVAAFPRWMSVALRVGENVADDRVKELTVSLADAARLAEAEVVSADLVIVADSDAVGVALTTLGVVRPNITIDPGCAESGDAVILTGAIGSESASLGDIVGNIFDVATPRAIAVPGEGGLEKAFEQLRSEAGIDVTVERRAVPVTYDVAMSGASVMAAPCQGIMTVVVDKAKAEQALAAIRRSAHGSTAAVIGRVN